jgi:hypothetical protein
MPELREQILGVLMQIIDIERRVPVQPEETFGIPEPFRFASDTSASTLSEQIN